MRLFIAINFTEDKKEELYHTVLELKKNSKQGTFTHKENLHLTLAFIGETKEYENIKRAMNRAVSELRATAFTLIMEGIGTFQRREGDIYWLGVKENPQLADLNRELVKQLNHFTFHMNENEFKPHLTLGRRVIVKEGFGREQMSESTKPFIIGVDKISLMNSERIQGKLVYTELYSCKLMN